MSTSQIPTLKAKQLAEKACAFLTASTDPFHAVHQSILQLEAAGFVRLLRGTATATHTNTAAVGSSSTPTIAPGGKYYYTVQNSTLVAFCVGQQFQPSLSGNGGGGFTIIGGHTDSPNLRIKPQSQKKNSAIAQTTQLAVECYGGGLWHTWFDRDLSISGKVLVRSDKNTNNTNKIQQRLVQWHDPIARVSTLCIHLQSASEREAFAVNKEDHTSPIIASANATNSSVVATELEKAVWEQISGLQSEKDHDSNNTWLQGQEPLLLQRLARELQLDDVTHIADFDLSLYDTQPAAIGGMHGEFLYSGRLDNLATVFTAVTALCEHASSSDSSSSTDATSTSTNSTTLATSKDVAMVVCFDHEEVGSVSANGAGSPVLLDAVQYVSAALGNVTPLQHRACMAQSFCLSIDQAHAVHPNYASKHDSGMHAPHMNGGVVVKSNANQRYTTNSVTGFVLRELGRMANVPMQEFCVRNDCPCGSTIGPTISALTGIRTVDAGMPQLSMHSCREVMGVQDLQYGLDLFTTFFAHFRSLDERIEANVVAS